MSLVLLILGILATAAGIVTIGFGIPINEFSLGNTMIVAGTTATAAGLVLIGLAAAVEQLTRIARAMQPRAGSRPVLQAAEPGAPPAVRPQPQLPAQPAIASPIQAPVPPLVPIKPPMPPVPPRGPFAKPAVEERSAAEPTPEPAFSAIERLRASLVRTERKADDFADAAGEEGVPYVPTHPVRAARPAAPVTPLASMTPNPGLNGATPPPAAAAAPPGTAPPGAAPPGAADAPKKPPLDFLFRARSSAPQPDAFDDVWPKRAPRREPAEAAAPAAEVPLDRPSRAEMDFDAMPDDPRPAAILKSGVVDGMAYTLYADGSIEAQLPQGTVRFGSIAELRSHIENNS